MGFVRSLLVGGVAVVAVQAQAASVVYPPALPVTGSVVGDTALDRRLTPSIVVVQPPALSLQVLNAPDVAVRRISPSVITFGAPTIGQPGQAEVARPAPDAPAPLASVDVPTVIRGGITGSAFPDPVERAASVVPEERRDGQPQVGNDGQPAADVSPGSTSAPSGGRAPAARFSNR